jgi:hypothetical protein
LNRTIAPAQGVTLEVVRWETHATPDLGSRAQEVLNRQFGSFEIFVGIMWKRFGTPTATAGSGTEEEFRSARLAHSRGACKALLFYFCEAPSAPPSSHEEIEQLRRVVELRRELSQLGLVWTYTDRQRFADVVRPHLSRVLLGLRDRMDDAPPLDPALMQALRHSKSEMQARAVPYRTPAIVLAMMAAPQQFLTRCLEALEEGLAARVRRMLAAYIEVTLPQESDAGFTDFDWDDHPVVQDARARAREEGAPQANEKHVVLSLLNAPSKTMLEFRTMLGPKLVTLLDLVHRIPVSSDEQYGSTPGRVFDGG